MQAFPVLFARLRAARRRHPGEDWPSPCVSVCRMHPATGLCEGCLRTLDEIARWGAMSPAERQQTWRHIEARHRLQQHGC